MSKNDKKTSILTFAAIVAMDAAAQIGLYRDHVVKPFGTLAKAKDNIVELCLRPNTSSRFADPCAWQIRGLQPSAFGPSNAYDAWTCAHI
jgi:hypothetical protein